MTDEKLNKSFRNSGLKKPVQQPTNQQAQVLIHAIMSSSSSWHKKILIYTSPDTSLVLSKESVLVQCSQVQCSQSSTETKTFVLDSISNKIFAQQNATEHAHFLA